MRPCKIFYQNPCSDRAKWKFNSRRQPPRIGIEESGSSYGIEFWKEPVEETFRQFRYMLSYSLSSRIEHKNTKTTMISGNFSIQLEFCLVEHDIRIIHELLCTIYLENLHYFKDIFYSTTNYFFKYKLYNYLVCQFLKFCLEILIVCRSSFISDKGYFLYKMRSQIKNFTIRNKKK